METPTMSVGVDEFRTHCLELINRVRTTGEPVIVTWFGSPIARLVPCRPPIWARGRSEDDPWVPCWDPEAVE